MKKTILFIVIISMLIPCIYTNTVLGFDEELPYSSYTYTRAGGLVYTPPTFSINKILTLKDKTGLAVKEPADLMINADLSAIVTDTGNNRVICFDFTGNVLWQIKTLPSEEWGEVNLFSPQSVSMDIEGNYYILDEGWPDSNGNSTENGRIIKLNKNREIINIFLRPQIPILGDTYSYVPTKLSIDKKGRMYVIARKINQGLIQLDSSGSFQGFIGAPKVKPSPWTMLLKLISTDEQIKRSQKFIPAEYSSVDISDKGFLYTTNSTIGDDVIFGMIYSDVTTSGTNTTIADSIRKLTPIGDDILMRKGGYSPAGDLRIPGIYLQGFPMISNTIAGGSNAVLGASKFSDIKITENGIYFVLDSLRNRVFAYDDTGNMLLAFGSNGSRKESFFSPVALDYLDKKMFILNKGNSTISVYNLSNYGEILFNATVAQKKGNYNDAKILWGKVLENNSNSELAYSSLGKTFYNNNQYKIAMDYFFKANDRINYSHAFKSYRSYNMEKNFYPFLLFMVSFFVFISFLKKLLILIKRKHRVMGNILATTQYAFYVLVHPFDGFWDIKYEKRGNTIISAVFLGLLGIIGVLNQTSKGFIFNTTDIRYINTITELIAVITPYIVFCISSWCLTTLMEGKGTFKDIFRYIGYCVIPLVIGGALNLFLSHFLAFDESLVMTIISYITISWTSLLIFIGTLVTHHYSLKKTILTLVLTALGMVIILFIVLFFTDLVNTFINFIRMTYEDLSVR